MYPLVSFDLVSFLLSETFTVFMETSWEETFISGIANTCGCCGSREMHRPCTLGTPLLLSYLLVWLSRIYQSSLAITAIRPVLEQVVKLSDYSTAQPAIR